MEIVNMLNYFIFRISLVDVSPMSQFTIGSGREHLFGRSQKDYNYFQKKEDEKLGQ